MLNGAYIHIREPDTRAPIIHRTTTHYARNFRKVHSFRVFTFAGVHDRDNDRDNDGIEVALRLVASFEGPDTKKACSTLPSK